MISDSVPKVTSNFKNYLQRFRNVNLSSWRPKKPATGGEKKKKVARTEPTKSLLELSNSKYDLVGPADKLSNIRQYRYFVPSDESKAEYDYRMMRHRVHVFNDTYWTQQNLKFIEARKEFIETYKRRKRLQKRTEDTETESMEPTTAELNEFYRQFLNDNYYNHYESNQKWIRLNFGLLIPAFRVQMYRLRKRLMQR